MGCTGLWYFLGDDFWNQLQYSVPMLGSTANTFCVSFRDFLRIQRCAWFNYSGYMHCVSQSTEPFEDAHTFSQRWWSPGDDFRIVSVFSAELGSTANTCVASVCEAFWMLGFSLGDDFTIVSVFSAELGSTVDTCWLQSMRPLEEFHTFST